ncbi:hypothetical protein MKEN_01097700 [Mycena kentingensis (nom. inval.)]|nr:hypothetical protein MKEN_01097700 [Mycena kentingensis (nom. inval.)]
MSLGFNANCSVCICELPVDLFRRLACGHCFCRPCIDQLQQASRQQRRCPNCRVPIGKDDAQPIYLDLVAVKPFASMVVDGLERMDASSKVVSVQKAGRKLQQVVREGGERDVLEKLLRAVDDFNARVVPVFVRAREQEAELAALKKQVEQSKGLRDQADEVLRLTGEATLLRAANVKLRKEAKAAQDKVDEMFKTADAAGKEMERARAEKTKADAANSVEIRRLKGLLERNADDRNKDRQKMEAISNERAAAEQRAATLAEDNEELQRQIFELRNVDVELEIEDEPLGSESSDAAVPVQASVRAVGAVVRAPRKVDLGFEGMPRPGFGSDWQLRGVKRKERDELPEALKQGTLLQLGPKHTRRVKAR